MTTTHNLWLAAALACIVSACSSSPTRDASTDAVEARDADDASIDVNDEDIERADGTTSDADAEPPDADTSSSADADVTDVSDGSGESDADVEPTDTTDDAPDLSDGADSEADGSTDAEDDGETDPDVPDTQSLPCTEVTLSGPWEITYADDVSIEYGAPFSPDPEGADDTLRLLFERYTPGDDVGTFVLGAEADADSNFGTCAHCAYARGVSAVRGWYARAGSWEARISPYRRQMDGDMRDLVLEEVEIDATTRSSTPIPGARCIRFEDFTIEGVFPPAGWECPAAQYGDGNTCECECGIYDPDCGDNRGCLPFDPDCPPYEPLPISDCDAAAICAFDPTVESTACMPACDWTERAACGSEATCVYEFGLGTGSLCIDADERFDDAAIGEACTSASSSRYQLFCGIDDEGFAMGWCDFVNVCRPICQNGDSCDVEDHTCRPFVFEDNSLGYCGPEPPEDG